MRPFQKPHQTKPTEPLEDDPSECLGNAIFWGVMIWTAVFFCAFWFIFKDEGSRAYTVTTAASIFVIDISVALIFVWPKRKYFVAELSACLLAGATYLWCIDQRVWAVATALVVCTADTILGIKALAEGWLSHYDDPDHPGRGL
jgi:hypothetical protein